MLELLREEDILPKIAAGHGIHLNRPYKWIAQALLQSIAAVCEAHASGVEDVDDWTFKIVKRVAVEGTGNAAV